MKKLEIKNSQGNSFFEMKKECEEKLNIILNNHEVLDAYDYICDIEKCKSCQGLYMCQQRIKGYQPAEIDQEYFEFKYKKCDYKLKYDRDLEINNNFEIMDMPLKLKEASLDDFTINSDDRRKLLIKANEIINN